MGSARDRLVRGYLHLIDTPTTSDLIAWSYYDGASWSLDVNIGGQRMWSNASLSARSDRLVMVHPPSLVDHTSNGKYTVYAEYFQ